MARIIKIVAVAAVMVVAAGSVAAQSTQRFSDVPPDHPAYEAIEWAAEAGVTLGYNDGTFRPGVPLPKTHAVIFMERYYDEILRASESAEFTRGDMMLVLHAISGAATTETPGPTTTTTTTTTTTAPGVTASCTHHHAGHSTHTHRRYSDGTVSGHAHHANSRTKCGYLWQ